MLCHYWLSLLTQCMLPLLHLKWHSPQLVAGRTPVIWQLRLVSSTSCWNQWDWNVDMDVCLREGSVISQQAEDWFVFWIDLNIIGLGRKWVAWYVLNDNLSINWIIPGDCSLWSTQCLIYLFALTYCFELQILWKSGAQYRCFFDFLKTL